MRKKTGFSVLCLVFLIILGFAADLPSSAKQSVENRRVLVLNFSSDDLNDIEERIFREMVIRSLHKKAIPVVSVMELESAFQEDSPVNIKKSGNDVLGDLCRKFRAGYAVSGDIGFIEGPLQKRAVVKKMSGTCSVVLYYAQNNTCLPYLVETGLYADRYSLFRALAEIIADSIEKRYK